ncbi:2629_t:CDS:2 [Paraglomus occultum]|uniref:2629_t:CDS:1 n=1 Tax=Paraglomus occultum TaxID=144539 RepID=A0A9N9ADG7_9GLOM|nr:2629_t:CDS:2 [Paraglomus occultum]
MWTSLKNYFKKHRRSLTITAFAVSGTYLLGIWAKWKFLEWQERSAAERTARENMKRRFQKRQSDCVYTITSCLHIVADNILNEIDVDAIINELQKARNRKQSTKIFSPTSSVVMVDPATNSTDNDQEDDASKVNSESEKNGVDNNTEQSVEKDESTPESSSNDSIPESPTNGSVESEVVMDKKTKRELWEEVKIKSFMRTISAVYIFALLSLLTHLQLNLLGRFNYLHSVISLTERDREQTIQIQHPTGSTISALTETKYLTFSWWLLQVSWRHLVDTVNFAVQSVLADVPVNRRVKYEDIVWMISQVRSHVEGSPELRKTFRGIMLPDKMSDELEVLRKGSNHSNEPVIEKELRDLLNETKDVIDSNDFWIVQNAVLNKLFGVMLSDIHNIFYPPDANNNELEDKEMVLAKLLPGITREAHQVVNGVPNRFLEAISEITELEALSAIIYTSFEDE